MSWIWRDGEWQDRGADGVPFDDRGWTHGLGLFETLLAVDGRPVSLANHLVRLRTSCESFGWSVDLQAAFAEVPGLLERSGLSAGEVRVRIAVSGGCGSLSDVGGASCQVIWLSASALPPVPGSLAVGVSRWKRNAESPLSGHKCASYAENLFLLQEAREHGWDEVLVFNHRGHLCEAATANVFVIFGNDIITPPLASGCLPGVTRAWLLETGAENGFRVREADLTATALVEADGMVLTSATRGVVPVHRVDGRVLAGCEWPSRLAEFRRKWLAGNG